MSVGILPTTAVLTATVSTQWDHIVVGVSRGTSEMGRLATMLTSALAVLTIARPTRSAKTPPVRIIVAVIVAFLEVHVELTGARTLTSVCWVFTTVTPMQPAQIVSVHFNVSVWVDLRGRGQCVIILMNVY